MSCTSPASRRMRPSAARAQKGMRVYGEPLIQHLTLDESEYFNKDWDHAARRVMTPPFRNKLHQDCCGPACRPARCRWWRPTIAPSPPSRSDRRRRFHQDPERHRRARRPHAGAVDQGRQHRPADDERVRRGDLDQHRQDPQHLSRRRARSCRAPMPTSSSGIRSARRRSRPRRSSRSSTTMSSKASKVTGLPRFTLSRGEVVYRDGKVAGRARPRPVRRARAANPANRARSRWKEFTAPRRALRAEETDRRWA